MIIEGVVIHGRRLGHKIGFPTANIPVSDEFAAENGVYLSYAYIDGIKYKAMSNLGCNPSVGGVARLLETHIFGLDKPLYDKKIRVDLIHKIRDEHKFETIEELAQQIAADKEQILKLK